ncbi:MAG: tyrosine-type recombinase/integrase [Pirellulales bacterium]
MSQRKNPPRYRLHKARNCAAVRVAGKDYYLGKYGSHESYERYARVIAEHWARPGSHRPPGPPAGEVSAGRTVTELAIAFVEHARGYYKTPDGKLTSEFLLIQLAMKALRSVYGRTPAEQFSPLKLKAVREQLLNENRTRRGINGTISRIKRAFRWGVENELVPPGVYHGLQAVAGLKIGRTEAREPPAIKPVPMEWIEATLPHCPPPVAAAARLQLLCGARPTELLTLRTIDLDRSGEVWVVRPVRHKTAHHNQQREIYFGPAAQAILAVWLNDDEPEAYLFSPKQAEAERSAKRRAARKTPLWPSHCRRKTKPRRAPLKERYTVSSYRQAIHRACDKADRQAHLAQPDVAAEVRIVPRWSPNRLRHNAGTALRSRYGIELSRIVLGHSSAEMTLTYAERDRNAAIEAIKQFG